MCQSVLGYHTSNSPSLLSSVSQCSISSTKMGRIRQMSGGGNTAKKLGRFYADACRRLRGCLSPKKPPYCMVMDDIARETSFKLDYYVLRRRYLGVLPRYLAHPRQQLLTPEQEKVLSDWSVHRSNIGFPLHKFSVRMKAELMCGKRPSHGWVNGFFRRHPEVTL